MLGAIILFLLNLFSYFKIALSPFFLTSLIILITETELSWTLFFLFKNNAFKIFLKFLFFRLDSNASKVLSKFLFLLSNILIINQLCFGHLKLLQLFLSIM